MFICNWKEKKCPRSMNDLPKRNSGDLGLFPVPEELSKTAGSKTQAGLLQIVTNVSIHLIHSDTCKDI